MDQVSCLDSLHICTLCWQPAPLDGTPVDCQPNASACLFTGFITRTCSVILGWCGHASGEQSAYKATSGWLRLVTPAVSACPQGGNFNGLGNQAYHPGGQQQQTNQGFFAQDNSGYGNVIGGGQQQQQAGNTAGIFGQPQHSGLQQLDSSGPIASQGMQLAPGGSMQDAFGGKAGAGGMESQQQQPQQNQQQG